jgi:hypothetical protein
MEQREQRAEVQTASGGAANVAVLRGVVVGEPVRRRLTGGDELVSLEVRTDDAAGRTTVPVAWFDPGRATVPAAGDPVLVTGTVRRRFFRVADGTRSRTEVVASAVVPLRRRQAVARAIEEVATALGWA